MASYGVVTCRYCKKKLPANEMLQAGKRFFCSEHCAREEGEHELADQVANEREKRRESEAALLASIAEAQEQERKERAEQAAEMAKHRKALLLWVFTGWLGGHRFYLGYRLTGLFILACMANVTYMQSVGGDAFPPAFLGLLLMLFDFFWLGYRSLVPKKID